MVWGHLVFLASLIQASREPQSETCKRVRNGTHTMTVTAFAVDFWDKMNANRTHTVKVSEADFKLANGTQEIDDLQVDRVATLVKDGRNIEVAPGAKALVQIQPHQHRPLPSGNSDHVITFESLDHNGNGILEHDEDGDNDELKDLIMLNGDPSLLSSQRFFSILAAISSVDKDKDGKISMVEWQSGGEQLRIVHPTKIKVGPSDETMSHHAIM